MECSGQPGAQCKTSRSTGQPRFRRTRYPWPKVDGAAAAKERRDRGGKSFVTHDPTPAVHLLPNDTPSSPTVFTATIVGPGFFTIAIQYRDFRGSCALPCVARYRRCREGADFTGGRGMPARAACAKVRIPATGESVWPELRPTAGGPYPAGSE